MTEETDRSADALDRERRMREQEESVRDREPAERSPEERHPPGGETDKPAPPGQAEQPRG
jgi:hypothetical protein